jgi:hypothetical protein
MKTLPIYGTMAEFASPQALVDAARRTHEAGYRKIDAYSPFPVEELAEAIGFHKNYVPLVTLIGGITGGITGYLMQYYIAVISYPVNVGGRPYHSWPSFIIVTFEMTILFGAIFAVFGMLALNGLPMPYHPVFNVPRFAFATKDRFFLMVFSTDPKYDSQGTRQFLESLDPQSISEVPS